jgi:integrase
MGHARDNGRSSEMNNGINEFIKYIDKNLSKRTGEQYKTFLRKLPAETEWLERIFSSITYADAFMSQLSLQGSHRDLALTVYRMLSKNYIPELGNAMFGIPMHKLLYANKLNADPDKILKMQELADDRTILPLNLILRYGIKSSVISQLKVGDVVADVDWAWSLKTPGGIVYPVTTKGSVPLVGCDILSLELSRATKGMPPEAPLVRTNWSTAMSRETIRRRIQTAAEEAGIDFKGIRHFRFLEWPGMHSVYHS